MGRFKPPGAYLIFEVLEGGLIEGELIIEGAYLKIQYQGYNKLARDVEERTGQEIVDSQGQEIENWQ